MRLYRDGAFGLVVLFMAMPVLAQTPPTPVAADQLVPPPNWAYGDLGCAPMLTMEPPEAKIRVVGSQDTVVKTMMGPPDTLVVSGGSAAGLQPGQRFYVRRVIKSFGGVSRDPDRPLSVKTAGWVQILGVDTNVATATIVYACDGILPDDYLEPFTPPLIAASPLPGTTPEYENMGHIVTGDEGAQTGGAGQLMNINRGSNTGVTHGQRYLVFRDKRTQKVDTSRRSAQFQEVAARMPLVQVGEVLVVAVRPDNSTVQIVVSKDAITSGDLIAPIK